MKAKVATFMLLLHLVMPPIVNTEMCTCLSKYGPNSSSCFREALQAKLTSTPTNIQKLQNMFYFSNNVQSYFIIDNIIEDNFAGIIRELITTQFTIPIVAFLPIYTFLDLLAPRDIILFSNTTVEYSVELCIQR